AAWMTSGAAPRGVPATARRLRTGRRAGTARHAIPIRPAWSRRPRRRERGFGYIGLLVLVALMGVALAAAGQVWHTAQQREKERELLFAGGQFRRAIAQFYANTPGKARRYPLHLEELLQDPRHPD